MKTGCPSATVGLDVHSKQSTFVRYRIEKFGLGEKTTAPDVPPRR